jgi:hypothetical protein
MSSRITAVRKTASDTEIGCTRATVDKELEGREDPAKTRHAFPRTCPAKLIPKRLRNHTPDLQAFKGSLTAGSAVCRK